MKRIKEFRFGDKATLILRVSDLQIKKTTSNADYASFVGFDSVDLIECKVWSLSEEMKEILKNGEIYVFDGTMKDYQGKMQFNISTFRAITEDDGVNQSEYYEYAPLDDKTLQDQILHYVAKIENQNLKKLVVSLLKKHYKEFFTHPAAVSIHHNYFSGLSYHTYSMLRLSDVYLEMYPFLNRDLVYSGVILHDLGKVYELSGPKGTEYSIRGNLLGHISIGANLIYHEAKVLGIEDSIEAISLEHLILSHHGLLEYGSPKTPQIAEAELLHLLDLSDSRMAALEKEITNTKKGEFTSPMFAFERKMFYVPDIKSDSEK